MLPRTLRFGAEVDRACRGLVWYLRYFAVPEGERDALLRETPDDDLRDFVAAVKPWVNEIEVALERGATGPLEARALTELLETWEASLVHLRRRPEEVREHWDRLQITGDRALNKALFLLFQGEELLERAGPADAHGRAVALEPLLEGWTLLYKIERSRTIPKRIADLIPEFHDFVREAEFRREEREVLSTYPPRRPVRADDTEDPGG